MANPTTNFGWVMPTSTDLVTDLPADFAVFGQGVDTSMADLLGGTTGQVLSKASATNMDFTWTTLTSITPVNPNLVINGNFTINQRSYVSGNNLASGAYGFDRWKSNYTNTTLTFTSAPAGQSITINASGGLQQIIEQANVPAGTYTLSWTGTATGRIYNSGSTAPSYASSPVSFTADGSANVVVEFTASGTTKTLSKVKLELGSTATSFNYSGETLQGELANCQRYYYRVNSANSAYATLSDVGQIYDAGTAYPIMHLPVPMRTAISAIDYANISIFDNGFYAISGISINNYGAIQSQPIYLGFSVASTGMTANRVGCIKANNTTSAYLGVSAEL